MSNTENEKTLLQIGLLYRDEIDHENPARYANLHANLNQLFTTLQEMNLLRRLSIRSTQNFIAE